MIVKMKLVMIVLCSKSHKYSPNYRKFGVPTDDDTRRTLLWNPKVKTDRKGEANLILYNNARDRGTIDISVRGINRNGKIMSKD